MAGGLDNYPDYPVKDGIIVDGWISARPPSHDTFRLHPVVLAEEDTEKTWRLVKSTLDLFDAAFSVISFRPPIRDRRESHGAHRQPDLPRGREAMEHRRVGMVFFTRARLMFGHEGETHASAARTDALPA